MTAPVVMIGPAVVAWAGWQTFGGAPRYGVCLRLPHERDGQVERLQAQAAAELGMHLPLKLLRFDWLVTARSRRPPEVVSCYNDRISLTEIRTGRRVRVMAQLRVWPRRRKRQQEVGMARPYLRLLAVQVIDPVTAARPPPFEGGDRL